MSFRIRSIANRCSYLIPRLKFAKNVNGSIAASSIAVPFWLLIAQADDGQAGGLHLTQPFEQFVLLVSVGEQSLAELDVDGLPAKHVHGSLHPLPHRPHHPAPHLEPRAQMLRRHTTVQQDRRFEQQVTVAVDARLQCGEFAIHLVSDTEAQRDVIVVIARRQ